MPAKFENVFKRRILAGEKLVGGWSMSGSPLIVEAMSFMDYDYVVLDLEHSPTPTHGAVSLLQAGAAGGSDITVRMACQDPIQIKHILDLGALTLMFPFVETAEEARAIAQASYYPPKGKRGFAKAHRGTRYLAWDDYFERANDEVFLIAQLESPEAIARAEEIGSVEGIGGLFIGPGDLSVAMGLAGNVGHADVKAAMAQCVARCNKMGVPVGTVMPNPELAAWAVDTGFSFVSLANDVSVLVNGLRSGVADFRKRLPARSAAAE